MSTARVAGRAATRSAPRPARLRGKQESLTSHLRDDCPAGAPSGDGDVDETEFESHPVACPACGEFVDAQIVLLERGCPACDAGYGVFVPAESDPEDAEIEYPFDGPAEVRAA